MSVRGQFPVSVRISPGRPSPSGPGPAACLITRHVPAACQDRNSEAGGRVHLAALFEIAQAVAHPDHTVTIVWSDGVRGTVDFLDIVDRGGWFTPLRDPEYFVSTMVVLPGGAGLTWPEEIDYSADGLRRAAFPNGLP